MILNGAMIGLRNVFPSPDYRYRYMYILILILSSPYFGGDTTPWLELRDPAHAGIRSYRQRQTLKNDFLSPGPHRPGEVLNLPTFEKVRYPCVVSFLVAL